jgi:hypothetical protein
MKEAVGTKVGTADLRKVPMSQTNGTFQDGLSVPTAAGAICILPGRLHELRT